MAKYNKNIYVSILSQPRHPKQKPVFDLPVDQLIKHNGYGGGLGESVPCINSTASKNYLNRADVRKALHIKAGLPPWDICRFVHK